VVGSAHCISRDEGHVEVVVSRRCNDDVDVEVDAIGEKETCLGKRLDLCTLDLYDATSDFLKKIAAQGRVLLEEFVVRAELLGVLALDKI